MFMESLNTKNNRTAFLLDFDRSIFRYLEVILTQMQQGIILGRREFRGLVLEWHLILLKLRQVSEQFVDWD